MAYDDLQAKLDATRKHLAALTEQSEGAMVPAPMAQEALEELAASVEEIQVLNEELRQQNDELFSSRRAVEAEQQRYRDLFEFAPDGYLVTNPSGIIREANRAAAAMLGVAQHFLLGHPLMVFVPEKDQRAFGRQLSSIERDPAALRQWDLDLKPPGGATFPVAVTVSRVQDAEGRLAGLRWLLRDVTEARRTEETLRHLSRRLVEVQEAERRALARELHDEIGQSLTVLRLLLDQAVRGAGGTGQPELSQAFDTVQALQNQVRELALDLRPSMLDDQGLLPALIWNIERFQRGTDIRVSFKHLGLEARRFPPEVETAAYRVVQEALTNVLRHAGVREAVVRLWVSENALWTQIEDRGVGFEPAAASSQASNGLAGMRERVAMVGGHLSVESATGSGTTILAEFPLA